MFLGSYQPSFDLISRRVALPKKIRDYLARSQIILSLGFEKCIFGFDTKDWERQSKEQIALPITERHVRDLRRFFFSGAEPIRLDNQGRFVIPSHLFKYAQIKKPIIVGCGDHFEIWDEMIWNQYKKDIEPKNK